MAKKINNPLGSAYDCLPKQQFSNSSQVYKGAWPGYTQWYNSSTPPYAVSTTSAPRVAALIKPNMELYVVFDKEKKPVALAIEGIRGVLYNVETGDTFPDELAQDGYTAEPLSLSNMARRLREGTE